MTSMTKPQQAWAAVDPDGHIHIETMDHSEIKAIYRLDDLFGSAFEKCTDEGWRIIRVTITEAETNMQKMHIAIPDNYQLVPKEPTEGDMLC